jgi:hypothetical protein
MFAIARCCPFRRWPAPETGELGFQNDYDRNHLTITVDFAASAYDKLCITGTDRPQDLRAIPWDQLSDTPDKPDNGTSSCRSVATPSTSPSTSLAESSTRSVTTSRSSGPKEPWSWRVPDASNS